MNRTDARKIADKITNEQLVQMFEAAKKGIKDWTMVSDVNSGITKGTAWNILAKDFDMQRKYHILAKTNMVREFAEYLPTELLPPKKIKRENKTKPYHQDPVFSNDNDEYYNWKKDPLGVKKD